MKASKGFTLIELMVVVAIIAILAVGSIAIYNNTQEKSRDAVRISDMASVSGALERYKIDSAQYVDTTAAGDASTDLSALTTNYIRVTPSDPGSADYAYAGTTANYEVSAVLESSDNASKMTVAGDGGNDNDRYEVGSAVSSLASQAATNPAAVSASDGAFTF